MNESEKINLKDVNKSKKRNVRQLPLIALSRKKISSSKRGLQRDDEGRFTSGSGGLKLAGSFNWKRAIPLIAIVLLVGGFSVYRSFAATLLSWKPGNSAVTRTSDVETVIKKEGLSYWFFNIPAIPPLPKDRVESAVVTYSSIGTLILNDAKQGSGEYCANVQTFTVPIRIKFSGAKVDTSRNNYVGPDGYIYVSEKTHRDFCVGADLAAGPLTIAMQRMNMRNKPKSHALIHRITKTTSYTLPDEEEISSTAGKFGFTWTQNNYMVPKSSKAEVANIHLYGWGSLWPFSGDAPSSEADNGFTVENRIKKSSAEGQEVMITACCAPSTYNTTGKAWDLDNSRVKEEYEQAYANRVAQLVSKYPEIKYVQVWNEFKGYWGTDTWDAASYTRFYNKVYAAVKAKRQSVLVGGGYVVLSAKEAYNNQIYNGVTLDKRGVNALQYWLDNARGFDAVVLDAYARPDDFPKIMSYVRGMRGANGKPLWWAEFYNRPTADAPFSSAGSPYDVASKIAPAMKPGDMALYWAEEKYVPDPGRMLW